jgi:hypothetical protein
MSCEEIREWLDKLIQNKLEAIDLKDFNNEIRTVEDEKKEINLYKGFYIIADILGAEIVKGNPFNSIFDEKRMCQISYFTYNGFRFSFVEDVPDDGTN